MMDISTQKSINADTTLQRHPQTIPALQEWQASTGVFHFGEQSRLILANSTASQLQVVAETFAADLKQATGLTMPINITTEEQPGDIVLMLSPGEISVGHEGYLLEISDTIRVSAPTEHGVFYATRTLLQLLKQHTDIPVGTARDWPTYPQRGLMVDVGRKYFSLAWLESHIRELAYLKFNYFHLHLSDNYGFRLESERHPEAVSAQHYTKAEIRALLELAQRYHITIVPEIDMPGHMDTILAQHPDLQIISRDGKRKPGDIDLSNEQAYALMKDLLDEFIPLFPGPYWHIGADEYLMKEDYNDYPQLARYAHEHYGPAATARDTYLGFVNWANDIVKSHGKITRVWNDGLYGGTAITIATDLIYEHWLDSGLSPQEITKLPASIMNCNADLLYYVLGSYFPTGPANVYDNFEQHSFQGHTKLEPADTQLLGAKLHIWCDHPDQQTELQIADGISAILRSLAQANWGSPKPFPTYKQYQPLIDTIGQAPGYIVPASTTD
ncbi:hypothetical protein KDA_65440 [Dictyobacter alpinus]|uniref:Uncharacterized protein n=1 Tax=Dictyobacter alpinus TaxID=2014873 RepID=A0A402BIA4_9CHLR|nr:family 20 glycosylhydrolase [Dictyobacter alpinus]GCE31060.1 hypothetical protein KDA_65440 [Dictyobacter alpinus]